MLPSLDFARERCIHDGSLVALLALANLGIALAYVWIPLSIYRVSRVIRTLPAPRIWWLFVAFILFCGSTHACAVLVLFRPAFYLEAVLCILTAIISLVTGIVLHRSVHELIRLSSEIESLREVIEAR